MSFSITASGVLPSAVFEEFRQRAEAERRRIAAESTPEIATAAARDIDVFVAGAKAVVAGLAEGCTVSLYASGGVAVPTAGPPTVGGSFSVSLSGVPLETG